LSDYKELEVWQKAMALAKQVYQMTANFPKEEMYGLTSQVRRAVVSIPSNIAEGSARAGTKEFLQFLSIARGSAAELETQLILASQLGYSANNEDIFTTLTSVRQMINALLRSLREKHAD
jgi:four helix bundle protein